MSHDANVLVQIFLYHASRQWLLAGHWLAAKMGADQFGYDGVFCRQCSTQVLRSMHGDAII